MKINEVSVKLVREKSFYDQEKNDSPDKVVKPVAEKFCDMDCEHLLILNFDTAMHFINYSIASKGAIDKSVVCPRELIKTAILSNAQNVILVHNHPSGDPSPSATDVEVTCQMKEAFNFFGIKLTDHIIVTPQGLSYSMKEKGIIS